MPGRKRRPRAYFAAPLFNEMERAFNSSLATRLEQYVDVFLPQRDGGLLLRLVKDGLSPDKAEALVFDKDRAAIDTSDFLVAVLDGAAIDEGVAFEIGYAFGLGKRCVGLQTDVRRALPTGNNPMISRALEVIFGGCDELVLWVANDICFAAEEIGLGRGQSAHRTEGQKIP